MALGSWLRLYGLQFMEFKADEQYALVLARDLLASHPWSSDPSWPALGMLSSGWLYNAPLFTWIVALFWSATHHPVGVAALVALANSVSLIPLWLWARRKLDEPRALLMLAIVAVSPFAVLLSRKIWMQSLLLPGLVMLLWSLELIHSRAVWRGIVLLAAGVLLVGQIHQSGLIAIALLPIAAAIHYFFGSDRHRTLVRWPPSRLESIVLTLLIAINVFFWLPYLRYFMSIDWANLPARETAPSLAPGLLLSLVAQVIPWDVREVFRADHAAFAFDPLRRFAFSLSILLGLPLCVYGVWRWARAPLRLPVIGIWWWLIIAAFAFARIPERFFYVLVLSPLPALLAAGMFDGRMPAGWVSRVVLWWRWAYVASLLALTVLTGAWLVWRGGANGDYGVSYDIREGQARRLLALRAASSVTLGAERGEVPSFDDSTFECRNIPSQVAWLAGWLEDGPTPDVAAFEICERWVGVDGDESVYRWAVRNRTTP